jgi:phage-related protein
MQPASPIQTAEQITSPRRRDTRLNQPRFEIGRPGDKYEKEADSVADGTVMHPNPNGKPSIRMMPSGVAGNLQMTPNDSESINIETEQPEQEERIQMKIRSGSGQHGGTEFSHPDTGNIASADLSRKIVNRKGKGNPLKPKLRQEMEEWIGADFSNVSVHTGAESAGMNRRLGSKAFTVGDDIFFNTGRFNPESGEGKHLVAHELTHTVQQGSSERIQRSLLGRAVSSIGGKLRGAAEWAGDRLQDGLNWLRNKLGSMVTDLPGYGLFTVFMGKDPVSGSDVDRNGRNFIEKGLEIIPNGREYRQKLDEEGALDEAAAWIDNQLDLLDLNPRDIWSNFRNFWNSLGLSDVRDPGGVFDRLVSIFSGPINRLIRFARNLASKFLEIVKSYLLSKLREFVVERESPAWYPLLTVILGHDPIMDEEVDRTSENILRGFIRLHPDGDEQLRQMEESGSFERAVEWIDRSVNIIREAAGGLRQAFVNAWARVTDIRSLMDPVGTFREIYNDFREPIGQLIEFAAEVASAILSFIKDALLSRLSNFARNTRGYPLIRLIIGRDPFTGEIVDRTVENLIHGFMVLLPGGEAQFEKLKESGAIERAGSWLEGAIEQLNITRESIRNLFIQVWESMSLKDLTEPLAAFGRIIDLFAPPIRRLVNFVVAVVKKLIEIILQIMQFPIDLIRSLFGKAAEVFNEIKSDPVGFLRNLLLGVKLGFQQFFENIRTHLLGGITDWLFGQLDDAGITPPSDLSFRSVFGLALEVLGITADRIFEKIEDRIGPERMERIRNAAEKVQGAWAFVKDVVTRGPIAIWERVKQQLSNLWDLILAKVRDWVVVQVIQRVTRKLLSMFDPSGIMAVINSSIAFFRAVQSVIEYFRRILEMLDRFLDGVINIARGTLGPAADRLENALASGLSIALGFLANQAGLGRIGSKVGEMIEDLRQRIDRAIEWVIDKAIEAGGALMEAGRSVGERISDIWNSRKEVRVSSAVSHELYFERRSGNQVLMLASTPSPLTNFLNAYDPGEDADKQSAYSQAARLSNEIDEIKSSIDTDAVQPEKEQEISGRMDQLVPLLQTLFGSSDSVENTNLPVLQEFLNQELSGSRMAEFREALEREENKVDGKQVYVMHGENQVRRGAGMVEKGFMKLKIENGYLLPDSESGRRPVHREFSPQNLFISNEGSGEYEVNYTTGRLDGGEQKFNVSISYEEVADKSSGYTENREVRGRDMIRKPGGFGRGAWDSAGNGFDNAHLIGDQFGGSGYNQSMNIYPSSPNYNRKVMLDEERNLFDQLEPSVPFRMNVNAAIFHRVKRNDEGKIIFETANSLKERLSQISTQAGETDEADAEYSSEMQNELNRELRRTIASDIARIPGQFTRVDYKIEQGKENEIDTSISEDDKYEDAVKERLGHTS